MNRRDKDVLLAMSSSEYIGQRELATLCNCSLGAVNASLKTLLAEELIDKAMCLTQRGKELIVESAPKRAVILAAGYGMRMVPIGKEISKGLLKVNGEPLVERLILQLREVGVSEIYVVVGFHKEQYEYLIDKYDVELIVNPDYSRKNNLHSLKLTLPYLSDCYIMPCDIWCAKNPFRKAELYSWYMVSDAVRQDSMVRINRKMELVPVQEGQSGNAMVGIAYCAEQEAGQLFDNVLKLCADPHNDDVFWENAAFVNDRMLFLAREENGNAVVEINTFEDLRELDSQSEHLQNEAITEIVSALKVDMNEITDIAAQKKGMTNNSFMFSCRGKRYIIRIPGAGTERLINRQNECNVYRAINGQKISDDVIYMNPVNGYKITEFLEGARNCDPFDPTDLKLCMKKLRQFHGMELAVDHEFNIWEQIDFYESLWEGKPSVYRDYCATKENVLSLRDYVDAHASKKVLTHIDAVPDNFLFVEQSDSTQEIRLIDWEYAGMQDPHVDIAMFCIYAMYDRNRVDQLIDIYFENNCTREDRIKIYCYIAMCGLLWSNWCEFKRHLGIEFGEYSLRQYRYAKDYYRIVQKELCK